MPEEITLEPSIPSYRPPTHTLRAAKSSEEVRRILVVDDTHGIHEDFRKNLAGRARDKDLCALEAAVFGAEEQLHVDASFAIDSAYQGREGLALVQQATEEGKPYALAFVDVRMPPGWDGLETARRIWQVDPNIQVVLCTAYSDHSWEEMVKRLGNSNNFLILKKPFDPIEVRQLAWALTEKWALHRHRLAHLEELNDKVLERTNELEEANRCLRVEMAERTRLEAERRHAHKLEALGQLTAGIGHEINNPLSYLIANLDFLKDAVEQVVDKLTAEEAKDFQECLEDASIGANRIKQIVIDIKRYASKEDLTLVPVNIGEALRRALKVAEAEIRPQAKLLVAIPDDLPPVLGDDRGLEQVLMNLLINAAHACEAGERQDPEIRVQAAVDESGFVSLEVIDTGCGISPENIESVFDPFFTTKEASGGTGLGLSTCHNIVHTLGGTLAAESSEGGGATFKLRLACAPTTHRSEDAPGPASIVDSKKRLRFLVVDDQPRVLRAIANLLERRGHQVRALGCARQALAEYRHEEFDAVLCDLMMPDMSGEELYRELQKLGPGHTERISFMTGGVFTKNMRDFLARIDNSCLEKPFTYSDVLALLPKSAQETKS